jgi:hypothetical protein
MADNRIEPLIKGGTMRKLWVALAALIAPFAFGETADAHLSNCTKWKGDDWGYTICFEGRGQQSAIVRCRLVVADVTFVYWAVGPAQPRNEASIGWCPDGYTAVRVRIARF